MAVDGGGGGGVNPGGDPVMYILTAIVGAIVTGIIGFWQRARFGIGPALPSHDEKQNQNHHHHQYPSNAEIIRDVSELKDINKEQMKILGDLREIAGRNDERVKALAARQESIERALYNLENRFNQRFDGGGSSNNNKRYRHSPV